MARLNSWEQSAALHIPPESGYRTVAFEETSSTMDVARDLLREPSSESNLLVLARTQTAGRGRQGRRWQSGAGDLLVTYALRLARAEPNLPAFSLAVGVVLLTLLDELGIKGLRCKWPNDIVAEDRRKLAGILLELVTEGGPALLVGIGVNMRAAPLSEGVSIASLGGPVLDPPELAGRLASPLLAALRQFEREGFGAFHAACVARSINVGRAIEIDLGDRRLTGTCEGISARGALLVNVAGRTEEILSGHVVSWGTP